MFYINIQDVQIFKRRDGKQKLFEILNDVLEANTHNALSQRQGIERPDA